MKKVICLCLVIMMLACCCVGCSKNKQKEEEIQSPGLIELEKEKITAENISPYEGKYLEYGDAEIVSGIYALKFTNNGSQTIRDAMLIFSDGSQELSFYLEMLPVGHSVIVAEQNQVPSTAQTLQYVDGTVSYLEDGLEKADCVKVTDNQNGTAKIENITEEMLPLVRVFYRHTDANGNPIGGPCPSIMIDGIEAGAAVNAGGEGWDSTCAIVTVLVINE